MAYIVRMPKMGVEMQTGVLLGWRVNEGDSVAEDDVIAEIESEKTTAEVAAREGGVLRQIVLEEGAEVPPGTAMGIVAETDASIDNLLQELENEGGDIDGVSTSNSVETGTGEDSKPPTIEQEITSEQTATGVTSDMGERATPKARQQAASLDIPLSAIDGTGPKGAVTEADVIAVKQGTQDPTTNQATQSPELVTPRARKRAAELNVDLTLVSGTGPHGSIRADDIESRAGEVAQVKTGSASNGNTVQASSGAEGIVEERLLSGMRSTIARRLSQSWKAPHVTLDRRITADALVEAGAESDDVISITDVLLKLVSDTLDEHPAFNATFEDDTHCLVEDHNIGFAVDIDPGLVTPVLRDVGSKTVTEIAHERGALTERVQNGTHTTDDLTGGTFTVSNLGIFGIESFTPIINPPQVAILGINAITEEPYRTERGIEFRQTMGFSLSFDHRVVDGADAARFLQTLAEKMEHADDII